MTESPYYTLIASPDAVITDAQGNVWSIQDGQVVENGIPDPTTADVIALAYAPTGHAIGPDGHPQSYLQVWQENASHLWWAATDAGWSPPYGIKLAPVGVSGSNTVITPSNPAAILDSGQNVWTIIDGQVARDGVADPATANVIALEYKNGLIWQENADRLWWSYSQAADGSSLWTPGTVPTARDWIGGGDNNVSNPDDWSPSGAPGPADTLMMAYGTLPLNNVLNVYGNALAGDTLNIYHPSSPSTQTINLIGADASIKTDQGFHVRGSWSPLDDVININASGGTSNLSLNVYENTLNVQVAPDSTLVMNDIVDSSNFTASGGTIEFIGDNIFKPLRAVFNDRLIGTATINESASTAYGSVVFMEVNGFVGCGLTLNLSSLGSEFSNVGLQIDHPKEFHGTINTIEGFVAFMGLHATSGEILNGMLKLFEGDKLVNATRFTGQTSDPIAGVLQLQQNSAGVMVTNEFSQRYQPGGIGTAIPLTIPS